MLQPSPTSPSRRSPTPVLDRSRTPNVHASSGHAAQFHALGFWILALTFGAQHAEEIGATLELVQNLLCLEDQMRTRGARALRTSSNHHARARAHHPLHAEVLAAPTTLHLRFQRRGLSRHRHIDSACARRIDTLVTCIYLSKIQRGGLPHRRQRLRCINTLVACIYLSTIQRGGLPHRRHTDVLTTTAMSSYVVFPAAANSTSLPSAPGQEFQVATCPTSPIASDANDILNHSFFLPRSLHMIFTCDIYIPLLLTPPSCVYRFLWERTVSIILYTFNFPFLIYSLYLSGGPIPWSK